MAQIIMSMFMLFNMMGAYMQDANIITALPFSTQIVVSYNGEQTTYEYESKEYNEILHTFISMCQGGYETPAFGVSLNDEVVAQKQQGMFVEFVFSGTQLYNDMPFESLLIQVQPEWQGFNLMRKVEGLYQGRCFYYNLPEGNNMQALYDTLLSTLNSTDDK